MAKQQSIFEKLPRELRPVFIEKIIRAYTFTDQEKMFNGRELPQSFIDRTIEARKNTRIQYVAGNLADWLEKENFPFLAKEILPDCMEIKRKLSNAEPHIKRLDLSMNTVTHYLDQLDKLSGLCAEQSALNEEINAFEGLEKTEYNTAKLITLRLKNSNLYDEIILLEKVVLTAEARNKLLQGKG